MTNFLFWNINRKPLGGLISTLAQQHDVDVIILAESGIEPMRLRGFEFAPSPGVSVRVFTRFGHQFIRNVADGARYSIRELKLPGCIPVLIAMLHLPILNVNEKSQESECFMTALLIRDTEAHVGHERTLVVGDFNLNPFNAGIASAAGFNAVMHRDIARRGSRRIRGERYPFFYNPMWNHFGDERQPAAGTYYYDKSDHMAYYWHMFDQVLVRPALLSRLPVPAVTIPTSSGSVSLVGQNGRPDTRSGSDHLPIVFSLNLKESLP